MHLGEAGRSAQRRGRPRIASGHRRRLGLGTLWTLDLASKTWQEATSGPNAKLNLASMAYDPKLNLAICRFGHRELWVYRCKGGCPADAFTRER